MNKERISVEIEAGYDYAYVINMLDSQTLYEVLKGQVKFEILLEVLNKLNNDLRDCLKNEKS